MRKVLSVALHNPLSTCTVIPSGGLVAWHAGWAWQPNPARGLAASAASPATGVLGRPS